MRVSKRRYEHPSDRGKTRGKPYDANKALRRMRPKMCKECGVNPADFPSKICPGCEAYKDHQR